MPKNPAASVNDSSKKVHIYVSFVVFCKWHPHEFIDMLHINFYGVEKVNRQFLLRTETPDSAKFLTKSSSPSGKPRANPNIKCMGLHQVMSTFWSVVVLYNPTGKSK